MINTLNYPIYAGGEFKTTNQILQVINPFSQQVFAETYLAGKQELEYAVIKSNDAGKIIKEFPSFERYEILMQIAQEIRSNRERLALLLTRETAKPLKYALVEIDRASIVFTVAAEEAKRLPKEYISLDWMSAGKGKEGIIKYFPIGLVAGITPFNFPLMLPVHKIAPALAAGCPIILKPAPQTPLSALELAKIIDNTDLPKGALSVLPMNLDIAHLLVTDERIMLLSFTGSAEVGWKLKQQAGKKKIVLELGGNAAVIITKSADIDDAVRKSIYGAFGFSGQICIHTQRYFVEDCIFDEFVEKFIKETSLLKYGDPEKMDTDISVMINEQNAVRIEQWVQEAVEKGAKILIGGKRTGAYFEPTILTNTNNTMKVVACENFAPVVCVEPYKNFVEAVEMVNNSIYGLQAGIFSFDIREIDYAFNNIEVGGVIQNNVPTYRIDHMPYGGVKHSGFGREGIKYAIYDMMEPKILVK